MTCPPAYFYNDTQFRAQFPAFANTTTYPEATLQAYYTAAGSYVANTAYGFLASSGATPLALNLLTAHLVQIGYTAIAGQTTGVLVTAGIDKVNIGLQQAVLKNQWQYWLQSTPYGQQLLALLQVQSAGGLYTPGGLGRAGFGFNGVAGGAWPGWY